MSDKKVPEIDSLEMTELLCDTVIAFMQGHKRIVKRFAEIGPIKNDFLRLVNTNIAIFAESFNTFADWDWERFCEECKKSIEAVKNQEDQELFE